MIAKVLPRRRATTHENGQVLVLFALFLVVFVGIAALTIDYGSWLKARRDYQNAANSAALAGSAFLTRPIDETKRAQAREAAWTSLKAQLNLSPAIDPGALATLSTPAGTPVTDSGYRLWVSTPPIEAAAKYPGQYTGLTDRYLFAWVEKDNPAFFARIFGQGDTTVSAWATAGSFPGRFAVITLRQNGQAGPANAKDIDLAGSNSSLTVKDGDVGGNWGMKLNSSSNLYLPDVPDDSQVYLIDYISCGNSCWSVEQINSGPPLNTIKSVFQLPQPIDDPNYPLPSVLSGLPTSYGTTGPVQKGGGTDNQGDLRLRNGNKSGVGCDPNSPRIGPGWYHDLRIDECVVLDPIHTYTDPDNADPTLRGRQDILPVGQQPGIFYITGTLNLQNNALLVGDGVTIVFRPQNSTSPGLSPNAGGVLDLNTGASDTVAGGFPNQKKGAYMTDGSPTYLWDGSQWAYDSSLNADKNRVGIAIYVAKPAQYGDPTPDANTKVIQVTSGSGLAWSGVTYAPHDNIELAGQPGHDGIGQFVSWTFKFAGGTNVTQTYEGPDQSLPRLVEPHLGQ